MRFTALSSKEALEMIPIATIVFVYMFFTSRSLIYRHEKFVREFYWGLSEKYVHSYVTPNKIVKYVRKCFGLETKRKLHWIICLFHYLQIAMLILPVVSIPVLVFIPLGHAIPLSTLIGLTPFCLMFLISIPFGILQWIRCIIIKKTIPMYANCNFRISRDREY